jgi:hypothetical protein
VDGIMGIRLIRRRRKRDPDVLASEPGRILQENFELRIGQWVAQAPRQALVCPLLGRQQLLECRNVVGSHIDVDQPLSDRYALRCTLFTELWRVGGRP